MGRGFTRFTFLGFAVRDPELEHTTGGIPHCEVELVSYGRTRASQGEIEKVYTDVHFYEKAAKVVVNNVRAGDSIYVEGYMRQRMRNNIRTYRFISTDFELFMFRERETYREYRKKLVEDQPTRWSEAHSEEFRQQVPPQNPPSPEPE